MSKLKIVWTSQFKKDYKKALKRNLEIDLLDNAIRLLSNKESLNERHGDHTLTGNWRAYRECHIQPDWLLIYKIEDELLILILVRTGSHSDLSNK